MTTPLIKEILIDFRREFGTDYSLEFWLESNLKEANQELLQELTEGVMIGSDGQRNCYFIPCERIDDTIKTLQDNK